MAIIYITKATAFSSVNLTATTDPVIPIFQASRVDDLKSYK